MQHQHGVLQVTLRLRVQTSWWKNILCIDVARRAAEEPPRSHSSLFLPLGWFLGSVGWLVGFVLDLKFWFLLIYTKTN